MSDLENNKYSHRIGETKIKLLNNSGELLRNTKVSIRQTKRKFLLGCAEFSCVALANNEIDKREQEIVQERFRRFFEIFNYATLPFYWGRFEPVKGKPDTKRIKKASEWMIAKGLTLKGHPLCWHTVTAPWLLEMSNKEILQTQLNRIRRDVADFEGIIDMWDVINEAVIMPIFDKYDNGITRICNELGRIRLVRETFLAAKKANPNAMLLINDFETSESYDILIEGCLEAGIPIDAIGIQSHMHQGYWGIEKTQEILERFSRFGLPIHFTENTIVSGQIMPREIKDLNDYKISEWPSTHEGEERQAKEIIEHNRTLFEHPMVESITWWGFVDGGWLGAPGGFLRKDGSPKPVFDQMCKLINEEWTTKPLALASDDSGNIKIQGFLGEYELSCNDLKQSFKIEKGDGGCKELRLG